MAAINFPSSPTVGQVHSENNRSWTWNGVSWVSGTQLENYYKKTESDARFDPSGEAVALSIALG